MTQEHENNVDKDALAVIDDPALLNLSEDEMLSLVEKKPEVQAKKLMSVLIKWAKKKYNIKGAGNEPLDKKIKLEEGEEPKYVPAEGEKKEDEKEEKVVEEKEKSEAVEPKEEENPNLIAYLQPFVQFMR